MWMAQIEASTNNEKFKSKFRENELGFRNIKCTVKHVWMVVP
jgi:hypothetical protein